MKNHQELINSNLNRLKKLTLRLNESYDMISQCMPLDIESFDPDNETKEQLMFLDAFRAHFSDLQDVIGKSIFSLIMYIDEEESTSIRLSTRERINLMEQKKLLDANFWREIREIRNNFSHEYPDEHREKADNLNAAWKNTMELINVYQKIEKYLCD